MNKNNEKLILGIVVGSIILLGIFSFLYNNSIVDFGKVKITKTQYKEINNLIEKNYLGAKICNLKSNECVFLVNIDNYSKIKEKIGVD